MILKPKQGKVVINYKGKRIELPTKATKEILSISAVKTFLSKGIVELIDEKEEKPKQEPKKESKPEEKPKQENKPRRGRPPKKK